MKGFDIRIQEKKAKLFNECKRFTSNEGELIESYYHRFLKLMNDLKRNKHFPEKIASNLKFLNNLQPEWSRYVTIVHQTKDLHTGDYTQFTSSRSITIQSEFLANMALALMAKAFKLNYSTPTNNNQRISSNPRNRQIAQPGMNMGQDRQMQMIRGNGGNQFRQYAVHNAGNLNRYNEVQNVENQVAPNPRVQNVGTQTDSAPVYDSDGSAEVHENYDNNEIFNMFTQEEQYTELLEPIPESHQVSQTDNEVTGVEQGGETIEQYSANFEETRALYESLYHNLPVEVEKVNSVNRKLKETNAEMTTELA
nr:hypothetical protein [Tanacetum cinerariifolium]